MNRRRFLELSGKGLLSALSATLVLSDAACSRKVKRPNIVFFLIDDLGWRDLSCYGSAFYETPAIDQLAREGVRFTQAYCAHPRCVPSRYSIMSGKFPARGGVPGRSTTLPLKEVTLAEALKEAGYQTFFAGKWHLGKKGHWPEDQGFDVNIAGGAAGSPRNYFAPYNRIDKPWKKKKAPIPGLDDAPEGEYLTDRLTDETIQFIKAHKEQPFFVYLSHYAVHEPLQARAPFVQKYKNKLKTLPPFSGPEYVKEGTGVTKMRQNNPVYAAMIQSVDESVQRILQTLKELHLEQNTLVIFTSDNGGLSNRGYRPRRLATSNQPLRAGKGWCYEGGIRVPLIVKWPGVVEPGRVSDRLVSGADFYPTLLEAAGLPLKPQQHLDGVSFLATLQGRKAQRGRALFWHSPLARPYSTGDANCTVVREGDWKLIDWYDEGRLELFNIKEDLQEKHNLADQLPQKRDALYRKIVEWRKQVNAYMDKREKKDE